MSASLAAKTICFTMPTVRMRATLSLSNSRGWMNVAAPAGNSTPCGRCKKWENGGFDIGDKIATLLASGENNEQNFRRVEIVHDGQMDGYLYEVQVSDPAVDLRPHPESTLAPGEEMLTTRELPVTLLESLLLADSQRQEYQEPLEKSLASKAAENTN